MFESFVKILLHLKLKTVVTMLLLDVNAAGGLS